MVSTATDRRLGLNSGAAIKVPCIAVATGAIALSGEQTIGGVTVHAIGATGNPDRVLVAAGSTLNPGSTSIDNGVWAVSTGSWTRDLDFDGSFDVVSGTVVPVLSSSGTTTLYALTTANPIVLGSTPIAFSPQFLNQAGQINYTPPNVAAAVPILASTKMSQIVSVTDGYGVVGPALGNAIADDTTAIQNAINALPVTGGRVYFPNPTSAYQVSAALALTVGGVILEGAGGACYLFQGTHNSDFVSVQAGNCEIRNLGFKCNSFGASQHWAINANASSDGLVIHNVRANNCYSFVNFLGVNLRMALFNVTNIQTASGIGVQINNANATVIMQQGLIGNGAGNQAFAGIYMTAATSVQMYGINLFKMGIALGMIPNAASTVGNIYAVACFFDTSNYGLYVDGSAAGAQVSSIDFVASWFNGHSVDGVRLKGTVKGASFIGCQLNSNTTSGLVVDASAPVQDLFIEGCRAAGNGSDGITIGANVNLFHIKNNVIGPFGGVGGNGGNGITVGAGTGNNYEIIGNDLHGNASGLSNGATGTTCLVTNNTGNPQTQTVAITVTGSPFSYTAGPSPEAIYINTGTVSLVTVEGVGVYSQTNCSVKLRPKQTVVVTYTVAPGMAKTIEG